MTGRSGLRVTGLVACLACLLAPATASGQSAEVIDMRLDGGGTTTPTISEAFRIPRRGGDRTALEKGLTLAPDDSIVVVDPFVARVRLETRRGRGQVALASYVRLRTDSTIVADPAGTESGLFVLEEHRRCGGPRMIVYLGALTLEEWPRGHQACVGAKGATLSNRGTAYALRVDTGGRAHLAVTEDSVAILWYGREAEQEPATPCDAVAGGTPCVRIARAGSLWGWSLDQPPEDESDPVPAPFLSLDEAREAWRRAVDYYGDDIWGRSLLKKPWFWAGVGGGAAILSCILWWCQGDDVTGTVIINP